MTSVKATQHDTNVGCVETQPIGQTNVRSSLLSASTNNSRWPKKIMCASDASKGPEENTGWTRRQRCTKQENGKQREHYHHPLLHKSNAIRLGVAAVAAGKGALLPVMSAIIHGQNGIQKKRKHPPRYWRSSKSYPVRHCGVTWTQRKGHLCNHSKSW